MIFYKNTMKHMGTQQFPLYSAAVQGRRKWYKKRWKRFSIKANMNKERISEDRFRDISDCDSANRFAPISRSLAARSTTWVWKEHRNVWWGPHLAFDALTLSYTRAMMDKIRKYNGFFKGTGRSSGFWRLLSLTDAPRSTCWLRNEPSLFRTSCNRQI